LNSAGFFYHNTPQSTLARIGISLYGLSANYNRDTSNDFFVDFKPVMSLKTTVSQVKTIYPGDNISYDRTFTAKNIMKIASLTAGYADGYSRQLSSLGEVLVHGVRCKVVGRICMDQFMIDVSNVDFVKAGDVVTLIGKDIDNEIRADWLASLYNSIPQDVVCGISGRVPRIVI